MTRFSDVAALIGLGITVSVAPAAHGDGIVICQFSVAKPFVYPVDGADYMRAGDPQLNKHVTREPYPVLSWRPRKSSDSSISSSRCWLPAAT